MKRIKFTTVALSENQYLIRAYKVGDTISECYMNGYENGKRQKSLDGYYFRVELKATK